MTKPKKSKSKTKKPDACPDHKKGHGLLTKTVFMAATATIMASSADAILDENEVGCIILFHVFVWVKNF